MSRYINIEKIVPANCPLGYDDCSFCANFGQDYDGFICHAETEEEED